MLAFHIDMKCSSGKPSLYINGTLSIFQVVGTWDLNNKWLKIHPKCIVMKGAAVLMKKLEALPIPDP